MKNTMSRSDYRFQQAEQGLDTGLNKTGKKNAKHREEILHELEATSEAVQAFLQRRFEELDPDDWVENYVAAAIREEYENKPNFMVPTHYNLADYDLLKTLAVLSRNLDSLVFERDAKVTGKDIAIMKFIRTAYVHLETSLNTRDWRRDVNLIRVFRSKFQTDVEIEREEYGASDIPQMSADATRYEEELAALKKKLDEYSDMLVELGDSAARHAQADKAQDAELERQAKIDAGHDEKDAEHDKLLRDVLNRLGTLEDDLGESASERKKTLALQIAVPAGAACLAALVSVLLFSKKR